jgi:hypothetical protein
MDYADSRKDDRYKSFAARASAEVLFTFLFRVVGKQSAYYRAVAWRKGVPVGLGPLLDLDVRRRRSANFHFFIEGDKVREVRRENSVGALRDDKDGTARWQILYREDGTAERVSLFNRRGVLVREEVTEGKNRDVIEFKAVSAEGDTVPKPPKAMRSLLLDPLEDSAKGQSDITRHKVKFDDNGFVIERRYQNFGAVPRRDAEGSFGQRLAYSPDGLVTRRAEIDSDGNEITLRSGIRTLTFDYNQFQACTRETRVGEDGKPINGRDGYAFQLIQYDQWGNETERAYFQANGQPAVYRRGWHRLKNVYNDRGDLIEQMYFGGDDKPVVDKDGFASFRDECDERGNVIREEYFGSNGAPSLHKNHYSFIHQKFKNENLID